MSKRSRCPICASQHTTVFLQRSNVPVHQNLVVKSRQAAVDLARGELSLMVCETCGFIFNQSFDPTLLTYDDTYDNTQSYSLFFDAYMDDLVRFMVEERGVR